MIQMLRVRATADFIPWVQVRRSTTTPAGATTHTRSPLSSPWPEPLKLITRIGISADELTFPPALAVSPHSLRLCHPSSFSCVCGRLSRRTTVLFPTPIITHNSGGVAAAIAVAPPDGTNNRSMVVTGNVPKFV